MLADWRPEHPKARFIVRVFQDWGGRPITPQEFFDWNWPDVERTLAAIGDPSRVSIEMHNEPNLQYEGLGYSWNDGAEFATWLLAALDLYLPKLPTEVNILFPGLSPGFGAYASFLTAARSAVLVCDGIGVHTYWSPDYEMSKALDVVADYVAKYPNQDIWITEASNNGRGPTPQEKANQYIQFWNALKQWPRVRGVTYYVASATDPDSGWGPLGRHETWLGKGIAQIVGSR